MTGRCARSAKSSAAPSSRCIATCRASTSRPHGGDHKLVSKLTQCEFTQAAHKVVLVGGPGTGKAHLARALAVAGITERAKRVCFYSTVDLVNALEQEKAQGKAGRPAGSHAAHGLGDPG